MGAFIGLSVYFTIMGCLGYGWVLNVITLFNWAGELNAEFWIRIVGVPLVFLGGVLGYIG